MCTVGLFLGKANDGKSTFTFAKTIISNSRFFFCLDQYYLNNTDFTYNMSAVNGVFYTTVAVTILFSLASLFGVIGSITVSNPHYMHTQ